MHIMYVQFSGNSVQMIVDGKYPTDLRRTLWFSKASTDKVDSSSLQIFVKPRTMAVGSFFKVYRHTDRKINPGGHDSFHDLTDPSLVSRRRFNPYRVVNARGYRGIQASSPDFTAELNQGDFEKMGLDLL